MALSETEALFHRLWGKATGAPGYVKDEWKELHLKLFASGERSLGVVLAERDAALAVIRAVYEESTAIHAAYKQLPEALRAQVEGREKR